MTLSKRTKALLRLRDAHRSGLFPPSRLCHKEVRTGIVNARGSICARLLGDKYAIFNISSHYYTADN